jgi:hypothetical protein
MRQFTMQSRAQVLSTRAVAKGSLIHDRATLGRCDTMREELITATRPTGQNYYRANPIGNELGTEPAVCASIDAVLPIWRAVRAAAARM